MAQQNKLTKEDIERIDALLEIRKAKTINKVAKFKSNPVKYNTDNRIKTN